MTVTATSRRAAYAANGVTSTFAVPFQFFEIAVYVNGALKTVGADYNITQTSPGTTGSVVFLAPPANGASVVVIGATVQAQPLDLVDNDSAPAETYEKALDRLTMIALEQVLTSAQTVRGPNYAAPQPELDFGNNPNTFLVVDGSGQLSLIAATDPAFPATTAIVAAEAATAASAAAASASAASASGSAASASASLATLTGLYNDFGKRYLGPKSSAPDLDNQGAALTQGALYFDTTTQKMRVYGGGGWADVAGGGGGTGTVTSVATGTGLTGGPINGAGTISMANMPANTLKGNNTAGVAAPADLTVAQIKSMLAITAGDVSGLAAVATNPVAGNISGLAAVATSGSASDLSGGTLNAARLPAFTGEVTSPAGNAVCTIAANAVTNAKLADMAVNTIKGRITAGTGDPQDLTGSQVASIIPNATTSADGLMSAADKTKLNGLSSSSVGGEVALASNNTAVTFAGTGLGTRFLFVNTSTVAPTVLQMSLNGGASYVTLATIPASVSGEIVIGTNAAVIRWSGVFWDVGSGTARANSDVSRVTQTANGSDVRLRSNGAGMTVVALT